MSRQVEPRPGFMWVPVPGKRRSVVWVERPYVEGAAEARIRQLETALEKIARRARPTPVDGDEDRKRDLRHILATAEAALKPVR